MMNLLDKSPLRVTHKLRQNIKYNIDTENINIDIITEEENLKFSMRHNEFIIMSHGIINNDYIVDNVKLISCGKYICDGKLEVKYITDESILYMVFKIANQNIIELRVYISNYEFEESVKYIKTSLININEGLGYKLYLGINKTIDSSKSHILFATDISDAYRKLIIHFCNLEDINKYNHKLHLQIRNVNINDIKVNL